MHKCHSFPVDNLSWIEVTHRRPEMGKVFGLILILRVQYQWVRPRDANGSVGLPLVRGAARLPLPHHRAVLDLFGWFKRLSSRTLRSFVQKYFIFFYFPHLKGKFGGGRFGTFEFQKGGWEGQLSTQQQQQQELHIITRHDGGKLSGLGTSTVKCIMCKNADEAFTAKKQTAARWWWHPTEVTRRRNFGVLSFASLK